MNSWTIHNLSQEWTLLLRIHNCQHRAWLLGGHSWEQSAISGRVLLGSAHTPTLCPHVFDSLQSCQNCEHVLQILKVLWSRFDSRLELIETKLPKWCNECGEWECILGQLDLPWPKIGIEFWQHALWYIQAEPGSVLCMGECAILHKCSHLASWIHTCMHIPLWLEDNNQPGKPLSCHFHLWNDFQLLIHCISASTVGRSGEPLFAWLWMQTACGLLFNGYDSLLLVSLGHRIQCIRECNHKLLPFND